MISVKWGDYTRRIGIDGSADSIKEAIKSAFRLRTKRAFWLEDEDQIIRSIDREMPLGNYTLHLDEGRLSSETEFLIGRFSDQFYEASICRFGHKSMPLRRVGSPTCPHGG